MIDDYNADDLQAQKNVNRPQPISPQELKPTSIVNENLVDSMTEQINNRLKKGGRRWDIPKYRSADYESIQLTIQKVILNFQLKGWRVNRTTERRPNGEDYLTFSDKD